MTARELPTRPGPSDVLAVEPERSPRLGVLRPLAYPVLVYVMSRVVVLSAAYFAGFMKLISKPRMNTVRAFTSAGSAVYRAIAEHGYPTTVPAHGPNPYGAAPLFPLLLRVADRASPLSIRETAIVLTTALGLGAALGVWQVARSLFDRATADKAVLLFCFLPGAYVLSFGYPDSLLVMLAAICLLALSRRLWVVAGIAGALATATRPIGLALVVCAVWVAAEAIRHRRDWRALLAPAITVSGWLAFVFYAAARTGEADTWFRAQQGGWRESFDAGWHLVSETAAFLVLSRRDIGDVFFIVTVATVIAGLCILWRVGLPAVYVVYTVAVLAPALATAEPRLTSTVLVVAFPIVITAARWLREEALWATAATLGSVMALAVLWTAWKPGIPLL